MGPRAAPVIAAPLVAALASCAFTLAPLEPAASGEGGGGAAAASTARTTSTSPSSSTSSSSAASGTTSASNGGSSPGGGGASAGGGGAAEGAGGVGGPPPPVCGNGVLEAGEQCDDARPYCHDCQLCPQPDYFDDGAGNCFMLVRDRLYHGAAKDACAALGGTLACIHGHRKMEAIASWLPNLGMEEGTLSDRVWLGVKRADHHSEWVWEDGQTGLCSCFADHPHADDKDCMTLRRIGASKPEGFVEEHCDDTQSYVCEFKGVLPIPI